MTKQEEDVDDACLMSYYIDQIAKPNLVDIHMEKLRNFKPNSEMKQLELLQDIAVDTLVLNDCQEILDENH